MKYRFSNVDVSNLSLILQYLPVESGKYLFAAFSQFNLFNIRACLVNKSNLNQLYLLTRATCEFTSSQNIRIIEFASSQYVIQLEQAFQAHRSLC